MARYAKYVNRFHEKKCYYCEMPKISGCSLTRDLSFQDSNKNFSALETLSLLSALTGLNKFTPAVISFLAGNRK